MNILKEKQFVSIPREEYEEMERVVNTKKDTDVTFRVSIFSRRDGHYNDHRIVDVSCIVFQHNDNVSFDSIKKVEEMIQKATESVAESKQNQIELLNEELDEIKSKWWYKLFNW